MCEAQGQRLTSRGMVTDACGGPDLSPHPSGPLSHLSAEQLAHERRVSHERVHQVLEALDTVHGPGATASLRAALHAEWEGDAEFTARARAFGEDNLSLLSSFAAEAQANAELLAARSEATEAVVAEGLSRYGTSKMPKWGKDAAVEAAKVQLSAGAIKDAATRMRTVVDRRVEGRPH